MRTLFAIVLVCFKRYVYVLMLLERITDRFRYTCDHNRYQVEDFAERIPIATAIPRY